MEDKFLRKKAKEAVKRGTTYRDFGNLLKKLESHRIYSVPTKNWKMNISNGISVQTLESPLQEMAIANLLSAEWNHFAAIS